MRTLQDRFANLSGVAIRSGQEVIDPSTVCRQTGLRDIEPRITYLCKMILKQAKTFGIQ